MYLDTECLAARSVHLAYKTENEVTLFYNEVTVEETTPCSYFMVCGWRFGYFGIQQLNDSDDKVIYFLSFFIFFFFKAEMCFRLFCFLCGIRRMETNKMFK